MQATLLLAFARAADLAGDHHLSYINRKLARQSGTNRTTQAETSNRFWLSFAGRVNIPVCLIPSGTEFAGHSIVKPAEALRRVGVVLGVVLLLMVLRRSL